MEANYLELIDEYREEMVKTLQELIAIKSVKAEPQGEMPFGTAVQEAFEYILKKGKQDGFDTENIDNYGGHIDFGGYLYDDEGEMVGTGDEIDRSCW